MGMELKILQYIDQMKFGEELNLNKVQDKERFIKTVKDIIDMGWDLLRSYRIKINNDYSVIKKEKIVNLDYKKFKDNNSVSMKRENKFFRANETR